MDTLKRIWVASIAGLCMAAASAALATDRLPYDEAMALMQQHNAMVIDSLLAEATPRSLALAATVLMPVGEDANEIVQQRREWLEKAAQMAPDDVWVQWLAALNAAPTDVVSEPALALQRLQPDNGAVWLFEVQAAARANDNAGVTKVLARLGAARRFENPFMATTLEWLEFYRGHPQLQLSGFAPELSASAAQIMATSRAAASAMPNYTNLMAACNSSNSPLETDRREACLAAGRLMLNESNTLDSMQIGVALLRWAAAGDIDEITRNAEYFTREYAVLASSALEDPVEFARYQADWLQTRNEIQIARNLLTRAGIPLLPPADWKPGEMSLSPRQG
ncbi:MAG: hypothetical protein BGP25_02975 [Lysobacterales bacterium 63-13]|nr:MAG: hypothetical protein BGP25_02975 [Xanthomonadales bacterium 63-13]